MRREEVFAGHEASSEWEEAGGMRLAALVARRFAPALFDNRWSKQGSGRGTLSCSHPYLSNRLRRPRFPSLAAGTGARAAAPPSLSPSIERSTRRGVRSEGPGRSDERSHPLPPGLRQQREERAVREQPGVEGPGAPPGGEAEPGLLHEQGVEE